MIPFNKPYSTSGEAVNVWDLQNGLRFKYRCEDYYHKLGVELALMTTSCTGALEMAALLTTNPGDEVIMPSYTFVTSASAFVRAGAKPVFIDSREDHPGMDESLIEGAITENTKAILVVHYAGVACDMDRIMKIAEDRNLIVIEDAAQCWGSRYKGQLLGTIGHIGCISYHETKNIQCGEGGMILINHTNFVSEAEFIYHKGTDRVLFDRGIKDVYRWVTLGSSFAASQVSAAYLWAQIQEADKIQAMREEVWTNYRMACLGNRPEIPDYATNNYHMYYLMMDNADRFIRYMGRRGVMCVKHYQPLHESPYINSDASMPNAERYARQLVRLPLWPGVNADKVITAIKKFKK